MRKLSTLVAALVLLSATLALGQGVQTGSLAGTVTDSQGGVLPGVTVTVTSPALQGDRVEVTDGEGRYRLRGLPPGDYTLTFTLSGMADVSRSIEVQLGREAQVSPTMSVGGVTEAVNVTVKLPEPQVISTQVSANIKKEELDLLPQGRTPAGIAALAPNLNTNTPNTGQLQIAGAFAYDNVFLVDGVDINDNLFGNANNLFIEDAIEETQVLTSGISAEYGRFSGGVINVITKSGGNAFSGSFRDTLTNDAWKEKTPFQVSSNATITDKVISNYEMTLGGPVLRDRVWFFGAGRILPKSSQARTLPESGVNYTNEDENKRGQIKFTGTITPGHTVQGSYLNNSRQQQRVAFTTFPSLYTIDPNAIERPSFPNTQFVANYRGTLTSQIFAEAQYSQKKFQFKGAGGTSTAINDSPILGLSALAQYNAPYFDATDPEDRNNHQYAGSVQYFWSKGSLGTHDTKVGLEIFTSSRTGGNSQSATGYVFDADYLKTAAGAPIYDANGRFIPVFVPGENLIENYLATRGATLDITTSSFYVNDRWTATPRLTFDLGLRYERVRAEATGDIQPANTDTIVPRLGASYDPMGNGRMTVQATYAHYAGKYSETQFGDNTPVGNPTGIYGFYVGPPGQGRDFAPGFNPANYVTFDGDFPLANVFFEDGLSSPVTREWTLQVGGEIGDGGYAKAIYVNRSVSNFIEDFTTLADGETTVVQNGIDFGTFSNRVYRNTDEPQRDYRAIVLQGRHRVRANWLIEGNYTLQLTGEGNFEGEAANQPGISSRFGDYPEVFNEARYFPVGRLDDYQRHRARIWTTYQFDMGRAGRASVSPLWRINSAQYFSLSAANVALSATQRQLGAGYATLPANSTIFFDERGSEKFKGHGVLDFSFNYDIPVFRTLRPYLQVYAFNILNNKKLIKWNTTIRPDPASPLDNLGQRTGYLTGATFGQGTANTHYPDPREFQVAFGFRF